MITQWSLKTCRSLEEPVWGLWHLQDFACFPTGSYHLYCDPLQSSQSDRSPFETSENVGEHATLFSWNSPARGRANRTAGTYSSYSEEKDKCKHGVRMYNWERRLKIKKKKRHMPITNLIVYLYAITLPRQQWIPE